LDRFAGSATMPAMDMPARTARPTALIPRRTVRIGVERVPTGVDMPRHLHVDAYLTLVLRGRYRQIGYAGRLACEAGDIVLQPSFDCHRDEMLSAGLELLRLPWRRDPSFGGVYRGLDVEAIRRAAERDAGEASALAAQALAAATPIATADDWTDRLACRLRDGRARIGDLADEFGLAREAMSRGFSRLYGVSPVAYRNELRARRAALQILSSDGRLCDIAADAGFADQAHMTREVRSLAGRPPASLRACGSDGTVIARSACPA
jgi:AraC-like DNA-binding protein